MRKHLSPQSIDATHRKSECFPPTHTPSQATPRFSLTYFTARSLPITATSSTYMQQISPFPPSEPSTISPYPISVDSNSLSSIPTPQRLIPAQITNFPQGYIASTISSVSRQLPMSNNLSHTLSQHQYPAAASCQCHNINVPQVQFVQFRH